MESGTLLTKYETQVKEKAGNINKLTEEESKLKNNINKQKAKMKDDNNSIINEDTKFEENGNQKLQRKIQRLNFLIQEREKELAINRKKFFKDYPLEDNMKNINRQNHYSTTHEEITENIYFLNTEGKIMDNAEIKKYIKNDKENNYENIKLFIKNKNDTYEEYTNQPLNNEEIDQQLLLAHKLKGIK